MPVIIYLGSGTGKSFCGIADSDLRGFSREEQQNGNGEEIVHFYTLAEAFDVILGKLDNVDEAENPSLSESIRETEGF